MRFSFSLPLLAAALLVPFFLSSPYFLHLLTLIAIYTILAVGLDIVFGYTGEISLGHAGLWGIGAYTAGVLAVHLGWGLFPALGIGPLVAALFGALLALPALRVTGPYLAMVTLAFGTIVQILLNEMDFLTQGARGISLAKPLFVDLRPFASDVPFLHMSLPHMREAEYYWLVVVILSLVLFLLQRVLSSRIGRAFEALRDSPIACDCMGVGVYRYKVLAFILSAGLAGLSGVLFAYGEAYLAPNNFSTEKSIEFLLAIALGGRKSRLGAIMGCAIIVYLPQLLADIELVRLLTGGLAGLALILGGYLIWKVPSNWRTISIPIALYIAFFVLALHLSSVTDIKASLYGMMILFVVYYLPDGLASFLTPLWSALPFCPYKKACVPSAPLPSPAPSLKTSEPLLTIRDVVMEFGGLRALDHVDFSVMPGTIHGLIGPNGSGKSTLINVLSGIYTPLKGDIRFHGQQVVGQKPAQMARKGCARTFQNIQLFQELTVLENVLLGLHTSFLVPIPLIAMGFACARREEESKCSEAMAWLEFVGLTPWAHMKASDLPYGKQRLLEIARALALHPTLLLLDEPAAGLTKPDLQELMMILRNLQARGLTLLLIEHHMDLVMSLCDTITVLDFGRKISEGTPFEISTQEKVISAYLGGGIYAQA